MVDDEEFHQPFSRFQFEPKTFLKGSDGRPNCPDNRSANLVIGIFWPSPEPFHS